jgi:hypothetical protein
MVSYFDKKMRIAEAEAAKARTNPGNPEVSSLMPRVDPKDGKLGSTAPVGTVR